MYAQLKHIINVTYPRKWVSLKLIDPGKPIQNAFIENFNGKYRDECLKQHWFAIIQTAQATIDDWKLKYNTVRSHSSLGYLPPVQFANQHGVLTARSQVIYLLG